MKKQTGFTLVELVIVIAVLGILAGMAIPHFMEAREEAAKKECLANRTQIMRMFYAQQAVGYSETLAYFLGEVTKEENNENKYFTFIPKCADNGTYSVSNEVVVCSITEHNEDNSGSGSVIDGITNGFQEFMDKYGSMTKQELIDLGWWPSWKWDNPKMTNDGFREAYYKENEGWPSGIDLNGNTIYFKFHKTEDGILVYANKTGEFKNNGDWTANYVYNSNTSKWYYSDKSILVSNINKNDSITSEQAKANEQKILDTITDPSKGWTEVTLNGSTFSK